jgi:hypothetical protein
LSAPVTRYEFNLTVADLHRHPRIRHEAFELIARRTVCKPQGGSPLRWMSFVDNYDLIIGAAIAFFLALSSRSP